MICLAPETDSPDGRDERALAPAGTISQTDAMNSLPPDQAPKRNRGRPPAPDAATDAERKREERNRRRREPWHYPAEVTAAIGAAVVDVAAELPADAVERIATAAGRIMTDRARRNGGPGDQAAAVAAARATIAAVDHSRK